MLADFCLRLGAGMTLCLLLLSPAATARPRPGRPAVANANFFRTQLLVALGLAIGSLLWLYSTGTHLLLGAVAVAAVCACLGSVTWSLERSPGGVSLIVLTALGFLVALALRETAAVPHRPPGLLLLPRLLGPRRTRRLRPRRTRRRSYRPRPLAPASLEHAARRGPSGSGAFPGKPCCSSSAWACSCT